MLWTRRRFIAAAATPIVAAAASPLAGCVADTETAGTLAILNAREAATLQRMSYLLFPYPDIGAAPYEQVVIAIDSIVRDQPDRAAIVAEGLLVLDGNGASSWLELGEEQQLATLRAVAAGEFFAFVLDTTKARLFNNKSVWAHIGYDPAAPSNDIDWLGDG